MTYQFPSIFDTNDLIQVVPNLKVAQTFLLDQFFPFIQQSDTEFVSIDVDVGKRRLAPFVSPMVEGKLVEQRRIQTNTFKPPYIKDKRAPDLRKPVRRMIGERIGGDKNPVERMMQNLEFEMADQIDMIQRRMEWMAAQCLISGTLTMKGDGFPAVTIDFGRSSTLTVTLTSTDLWDHDPSTSTATPALDIDEWQNRVLKASGSTVTDIVFTPTPWYYFTLDKAILNAIVSDTSKFAYPNKNQVQMASEAKHGAVLKGVWGSYRLWVYNDWYVDSGTEGGTLEQEYRMIPDGTILLTSAALMGVRAFGVIMDPDFNYEAMPYAPKIWTQPDPAQRFMLMQSAPLPIPARVNACLSAVVTANVQP